MAGGLARVKGGEAVVRMCCMGEKEQKRKKTHQSDGTKQRAVAGLSHNFYLGDIVSP